MNELPKTIPASPFSRDLPKSKEAEEYLLSACFIDGNDVVRRCIEQRISAKSFFYPSNQIVFGQMLSLFERNIPISTDVVSEELRSNGKIDGIGGFTYLTQISSLIPTTAQANYFVERVRKLELLRDTIRSVIDALKTADDPDTKIENVLERIRDAAERNAKECAPQNLKQLEARRVTAAKPPPKPVTRFFLAGKDVATPGNLVSVIARAKSGKTAAIGGAIASAVAAAEGRAGLDTLGFTASNPEGKALLVIDTEQSTYDAHACILRSLRRGGQECDPPWLYAYSMAGCSAEELRDALPVLINDACRRHGGIFAIILDGVADFVTDVNDPKECNPFVAELHGLAIQHDCVIFGVIHSNEGKMAGDDGRGHLGKQLMRKAESNLVLKKEGDVTIITSEKQRKAPITVEDGVAFKWSDDEGRHVSCVGPEESKQQVIKAELGELAAEAYGPDRGLKFTDLVAKIIKARDCSKNTAERRITKMRDLGVIRLASFGQYERVA